MIDMTKMVNVECNRCGGKGIMEEYRHLNGGTCFKCNGTGTQEITERAYKARQAKEQKAREEMERSIQLQREDEQHRRNRKVYSFLPASWNTFQDKEKIKKAGFKFDRTCGWVIVKTFDSEEAFNAFHDELEGKAQAEGLKGILYMEADAYEVFSSARDAQEGIREGMKESGF